ncbi:MAG: histidine phosphatase family protein [Anaerolineales bacterium]|nr:histidine phosphatase family protein [Anaerolineales bacterium]
MNPPVDTVRLILIRHGTTIWNSQNRFIGTTDLPLDENGKRQAKQLASHLTRDIPDVIYSSNLKRAAETAAIIAESCSLEPVLDPRLREIDFGIWEGLTLDEISLSYSSEYARWTAGIPVPNMNIEPSDSLLVRAGSFLHHIRTNHRGDTVLTVSHGAIMQAIIFLALSLPYRNDWYFYMYNGSISELWLKNGSAAMVRLNDTHHLDMQ